MQGNNALVALEKQLQPLAPRLAEVLGRRMPVERLIRTVVLSVERVPDLLLCDRQSLFNSAMSAAVLGLEVDGVTGQAYLIPFNDRRNNKKVAQLIIGYKGYNTIAARSGISVDGAVVREGDEFEYELGSAAFVRHVPMLGSKGRIIAAWACATSRDRPAVPKIIDIDEIMAIKTKAPGAKRQDSPWNDPHIGFPAMAEKSAKRRLARVLPLNVAPLMHYAARMEEAADEQGAASWINPDRGVVIDGDVIPPRHDATTPSTSDLIGQANDDAELGADNGDAAETETDRLMRHEAALADAAGKGMAELKSAWSAIPPADRKTLKSALETRFKAVATEADQRAGATA